MYGLRERDLEYIYVTLSKWPQVEKAIIFGSRALGNYKKGYEFAYIFPIKTGVGKCIK